MASRTRASERGRGSDVQLQPSWIREIEEMPIRLEKGNRETTPDRAVGSWLPGSPVGHLAACVFPPRGVSQSFLASGVSFCFVLCA